MNAINATTPFPAYFNMRKDGFFLGVLATGSQVLLLREMISSLQGDELFIGTAFFGWLLWTALGAYFGAKARWQFSIYKLFALAALLLPTVIVATRLSTSIITGTIGELIPFSYAALLSFILTLPSAFVCGWLFSAIVRREGNDAAGILRIYFSEGVGAFAAGALVSLLTTSGISTLSTAGGLSCLMLAVTLMGSRIPELTQQIGAVAGVTAAIVFIILGPGIDRSIDRFKYRHYTVSSSFDTPYSHQTILGSGGEIVLLTDNTVERVQNDVQSAENILLPPLAYVNDARDMLIFGQVDMTLWKIMDSIKNLSIKAVDTRKPLVLRMDIIGAKNKSFQHIQDDPAVYLRSAVSGTFDIIVIPLDEGGSYRGLRLMTSSTLADIRRVLKPHGVLQLITNFDTDRYISQDDERLLSIIRATLAAVFPRVIIWPGSSTLFLAGDTTLPLLPPDSIAARLDRLEYRSQFLDEGYLSDRLNSLQLQRIDSAASIPREANTVEKPTLAGLQIARRSSAFSIDRWVSKLNSRPLIWGVTMICLAMLLVGLSVAGRKGRWPAIALYFAAGLISLNLELVSFYVYQSSAGILYSQLSMLIGTFMLGLAIGTRASTGIQWRFLAPGTLAIFTVTTLLFLATCLKVPSGLTLLYHMVFQFIVAFCTGALFVAATRQYYGESAGPGGFGYAIELAGSALSALITMPLLLPSIGLRWLLLSVAILTGLLLTAVLFGKRSDSDARAIPRN